MTPAMILLAIVSMPGFLICKVLGRGRDITAMGTAYSLINSGFWLGAGMLIGTFW